MRIFPLGENALTVEFGSVISAELNDKALAIADHFHTHPFAGFVEAVPAYASTTIFYDLICVQKDDASTAFDTVRKVVEAAIANTIGGGERSSRLVEIPVSFEAADSLDLIEAADISGLEPDQIIRIFVSSTYRVYMIGFLPGFAYMGEVDERIELPRKSTPRQAVPKGSVGIAGRQTGIYPLESPGGWQIIGRTNIEMFTPYVEDPCYLAPGDEVRFVPVAT